MCWLVFFYCCEIRDPFEEQAALYDPRPSVSVLSFSLACYGWMQDEHHFRKRVQGKGKKKTKYSPDHL